MLKKVLVLSVLFVSLYAKETLSYGLGLGFISTPAYIGSDKQNNRFLPFPYIDYKGKYFNINRDKIYNQFYDKNRLQMEVSIRGMLPSKSEDTAREGMPNLDTILEFGPMLTYNLREVNNAKLSLLLPLRAAFSLGSDSMFEYQGALASLDLQYKDRIFSEYNFILTTGLGFNDKKINDYYYEVQSQYVTSSREQYSSKSGYSGFHTSLALTKKEDKFWYGGFIKHYYLEGAQFEKSPLVETKNSLFYGLAFSYLF